MSFPNPGPALNGIPNTSAQIAVKGRPFRGKINAVLPAGTVDNWSPQTAANMVGYVDAVYFTMTGNTTLNGFDATGYHQGDRVQLWNQSTTYTVTIQALQNTSYAQNQFELNSGGPVTLPPTTGATMTYSGSYWFFS
jgi:hypothetical protein